MASFNPQSMALRGRIGAYVQHSRHDPRETTKAARAAFQDKFLEEVDPEHRLPEEERQRRAEAARKAYYARLAYQSAKARRKREAAPTPEPEPVYQRLYALERQAEAQRYRLHIEDGLIDLLPFALPPKAGDAASFRFNDAGIQAAFDWLAQRAAGVEVGQ